MTTWKILDVVGDRLTVKYTADDGFRTSMIEVVPTTSDVEKFLSEIDPFRSSAADLADMSGLVGKSGTSQPPAS